MAPEQETTSVPRLRGQRLVAKFLRDKGVWCFDSCKVFLPYQAAFHDTFGSSKAVRDLAGVLLKR
jgi:hypothetical protein